MPAQNFILLHWHALYHFVYPFETEYKRRWYPARYANYLLKTLGGFDIMARNNGNNRNNFTPVEFVTINLSQTDADDYNTWVNKHQNELVSMLADFISEDHKISVTFDVNNACFIASATCKDEKSENANRCISARSDDWHDALFLLLYKHQVKAKRGDWSAVSRPSSWG